MPSLRDGPTVILDNGASDIKACVLPSQSSSSSPSSRTSAPPPPQPFIVPNALAKPGPKAIPPPVSLSGKSRRPHGHYVGTELHGLPDVTALTLRRAHERGFVTSYDVQRDVWASLFSSDSGLDLDADTRRTSRLILTEHLGAPLRVRRATDELVYETFEFDSCSVCPSQYLAALTLRRTGEHVLVLDSGFSSSIAVPVNMDINNNNINIKMKQQQQLGLGYAAKRLSLGGKALTNLLKATVSFRSWNMSDETVVMNAVKERCCKVTSAYTSYTNALRQVEQIQYLLPDGLSDRYGRIAPQNYKFDLQHDQVLPLRNERIAIPEALFHPADIGIPQMGIAELAAHSIQACPKRMHPDLYANVLLVGGNCKFQGFRSRFEQEFRALVCADYDVVVHMDKDPTLTAFSGAVVAARMENPPLDFITREKYNEVGTDAILRELYGDVDVNNNNNNGQIVVR